MDDCLHSHDYICGVPELECGNLPEIENDFFIIDEERESDICGKARIEEFCGNILLNMDNI
jgi:hypothetical protein